MCFTPKSPGKDAAATQDPGRLEGLLLTLQKSLAHRWDRLAQNHSAVKNFLRKDWVQDDGDLEEEKEPR